MKAETVIGALIAAVIGGMTAFLALINQDGVGGFADISETAWIVLGIGTSMAFLKDYQAITTRRILERATGSGNIHSHWTMGIVAIVLASAVLASGCTGTKDAYQAAAGPGQNAKVVAEHYYALVKEANNLKKSGILVGDGLARAQQLVRETRASIDILAAAAYTYELVQNATNQAELEVAIAQAAIAVSRLIDIIKAARDSSSLQQRPDDDDDDDDGEEIPLEEEPLKKAA
jgi:hypothetical protein